ncbi:hypothetical protein C0Q70_05184 [Pomacea canaliculata]|uniref:B30.2/SPRY domain-containing protein n=2 Tax=Pomacea canaliculata TaxID=400727 RepID=A0A2T7PKJ7_POMCA|nr:hypothetical protein C0Q70_05184 [Pomacea canaliculata]
MQRNDEKKDAKLPHRFDSVLVDGDLLSYSPNVQQRVGVYIAAKPVTPENNYFELEIIDPGVSCCIAIGLVPYQYPLYAQPGWKAFGVGYHADDGRLYKSSGMGQVYGPRCHLGDHMGCGIKFPAGANPKQAGQAYVFFTRNGKELGSVKIPVPQGGLHPAVGLHSDGEEVRLNLDAEWPREDAMLMAIDHCEEDWRRLHDIKLIGQILEYDGRGKTIHDVGLAQARLPLTTTNHYFELEIVDPGENCYIAIGIARKNYPKHRHPGWNRESIAYHADDGKIFLGSGIGDPFGPKCHKGDIMGCGILFPPDYDQEEANAAVDENEDDAENEDSPSEYGDDEEYEEDAHPKQVEDMEEQAGTVEVFFTRNGKFIGKRRAVIPKGGFYPTIGMLSSCERVRVDLNPLTG